MMNSEEILKKIREGGEKPVPAWHFAAAKWAVRVSLGLALLAVGAAAGLAVWEVAEPGSDVFAGRVRGFPAPAVPVMPFLWLALSAAALAGAIFAFRRLATGHRWRFAVLLVTLMAGAGTVAAGAAAVGGPLFVEKVLRAAVPGYSDWADERRDKFFRSMLHRPEAGAVAGEVKSVSGSVAVIEALDGEEWSVESSGGAAFPPFVREGRRIRAFGEAAGTGSFRAAEVLPFPKPGEMRPGMREAGERPWIRALREEGKKRREERQGARGQRRADRSGSGAEAGFPGGPDAAPCAGSPESCPFPFPEGPGGAPAPSGGLAAPLMPAAPGAR